MPPLVNRTEYLEIKDRTNTNYIPLATPAWRVINLEVLYDGPAVRGENQIIPGVAGTSALPVMAHESTKTLELVIFGGYDNTGAAHTNARLGVRANLLYLVDNLVLPGTSDTSRAAILHMLSGSTRTANVQIVGGLRAGKVGGGNARATLDIRIPAGYFA